MKQDLLELLLKELLTKDKTNENIAHVKYNIGNPVIVRCRDAGVHCGILIDYYDRTAILEDSRRMWKWCSAKEMSLSGVARHGIRKSDSKIAGTLKGKLVLPEFCEIIPFQDQNAFDSIKDAEVYNEQ